MVVEIDIEEEKDEAEQCGPQSVAETSNASDYALRHTYTWSITQSAASFVKTIASKLKR